MSYKISVTSQYLRSPSSRRVCLWFLVTQLLLLFGDQSVADSKIQDTSFCNKKGYVLYDLFSDAKSLEREESETLSFFALQLVLSKYKSQIIYINKMRSCSEILKFQYMNNGPFVVVEKSFDTFDLSFALSANGKMVELNVRGK